MIYEFFLVIPSTRIHLLEVTYPFVCFSFTIRQVCRKQVYTDSFREQIPKEDLFKAIKNHDDMGDICNVLIQFMLSSSNMCGNESKPEHEKLLEEIDMFFQISTTTTE